MTEKRSDYRKRQNKKKGRELLDKVKSAFDEDEKPKEDVNVVDDFRRNSAPQPAEENSVEEPINESISKPLLLKKRLNHAISFLLVLIVLVLLALFYL